MWNIALFLNYQTLSLVNSVVNYLFQHFSTEIYLPFKGTHQLKSNLSGKQFETAKSLCSSPVLEKKILFSLNHLTINPFHCRDDSHSPLVLLGIPRILGRQMLSTPQISYSLLSFILTKIVRNTGWKTIGLNMVYRELEEPIYVWNCCWVWVTSWGERAKKEKLI